MSTDGRGPRQRIRIWAWAVAVAAVIGAGAVVVLHPWSEPAAVSAHASIRPASRQAASTSGTVSTAPVALDPTEFADGACVALSPTSGDRHQTVFVDAGHGGPDPGAVSGTGNGIEEKNVTLPVALDTAQQLRAVGYRVVLSRTSDSSVVRLTPADLHGVLLSTPGAHADLIARVTCANLSGAAALVSIHFDAYPNSGVGGATTLYDTSRPFSASNQALASALQQQIVANLATGGWHVHSRGITNDSTAGGGEITATGTAYGHLDLLGPVDPGHVDHPTTMPGALVEPLFLTNPGEAAIAVNPTAQQAIATGIVDAVTQFLRKPQ